MNHSYDGDCILIHAIDNPVTVGEELAEIFVVKLRYFSSSERERSEGLS